MAETTYTLWYRGQGSTTSGNGPYVHFVFRPTYINDDVTANIPKYSIISKAIVAAEIKRNGLNISTSNTDISWVANINDDEELTEWGKQKEVVTTSFKDFSNDCVGYFESGNANAGLIKSSLCDHLSIKASGTLSRTYTGQNRRIVYTFTFPTYKISATAGTGGTVSGDIGTYDVTIANQTKTIKATANTGYKFVGWKNSSGTVVSTSASMSITISHNSISAHSTTVSYTAVFEKLKYTVTWKNGDTVLETDTNVEYGTTPTYNGSTPTKASTAQYSYTFSGWSPSVGAITGNTTYTAQFTSAVRKYTISTSVTPSGSGTVSGGGSYDYNSSITLTATPAAGYRFKKWNDGNTSASRTITVTGAATYTATFERTSCTVSFKNTDGSAVSSKTLNYGSTLGTLPTVSREGYTFAGWIPCEPAKKMDGTVLDSRQYLGDSASAQALSQSYKYSDKFAIHIEAYMEDWSKIDDLNAQIMSCTEGGGWGLGYQARTGTTSGTEIYNSGSYKVIDLGFATDAGQAYLNDASNGNKNKWHSFDLVFSAGTYKAYLDGVEKGTQTLSAATLSYHSANTIFVGAEAGSDTTTPAGGYFKGLISNVFIANESSRLAIATTSTVVEKDVVYYPVWRLNTYTVTASGENGTVTGDIGTFAYGESCVLTATPNSGYRFVKWIINGDDEGVSDNPLRIRVNQNLTLTAVFEKLPPEIVSVTITRSTDLAKVTINTPVEAGAKFIISVEVT